MSGLNRDDVIRMAREAGITNELIVSGWGEHWIDIPIQLERFANLVAAAEREKVAQWMMQRGYATGHGDTIEDLLAELDWQIAENWNRAMINGMKTEREACAKVCDELVLEHPGRADLTAKQCATAIRARGQG